MFISGKRSTQSFCYLITLFTGRTTIIVAHRLSTIRSADKIVAIRDGIVREIGTHDALMQKEGLYHSLVMAQISSEDEGAKYLEFFPLIPSKTREKYISSSQLVLLSLYIF